MVRELSKSYDL